MPVAVAVVAVAILGVAVGWAIGFHRRPPVPGRAETAPREPADPIASVLRDAVNHLNLGVVVCDAKGSIVYRNRSASALDGTHAGLVVDDHVSRLLSTARGGRAADGVLELRGPPRMAMLVVAEPTPDGGAVATVLDVSERVRIDAMRTDFVANISHELKTPVGALAVLAETLLDECDPEVSRRVAQRMIDESDRAVRAIDDLLELSWIESATAADDVVDLHDVVETAIARSRVEQAERAIRVTSLEPTELVTVRGDRRQLVSALANLVENAVKYSDDEGVVQVRTRVDQNAVEMMVVDQGVGIPRRDLDRIFERFYRVDKARSRVTGGTGLGLAIVRHVASNHGGDVQVSSTEGEGSTFVLRLPAQRVVGAARASEGPDADRVTEGPVADRGVEGPDADRVVGPASASPGAADLAGADEVHEERRR